MYFTDQILKFLKARENSILVENYHLSRIFAQVLQTEIFDIFQRHCM